MRPLTPTDKGDNDEEFAVNICGDDGFLEYEQSFGSHPHQADQCEVVDEGRNGDTKFKQLNTLNASCKTNQHQDHSDAELDAKNRTVTLTEFSVEGV